MFFNPSSDTRFEKMFSGLIRLLPTEISSVVLIVCFDVRINRISRISLGQTQARGRNMAVRDHVSTQGIRRSPHALARAVTN